MVTCCDYIYILGGHTYIMNVTDRQFFWRSPSTARTSTKCFCFCFLCFLSFSQSFVNKDLNDTHRKPPYKLHPRSSAMKKILCHDHLEQILNTSNVEILHHLVLAT